MGTIVKSKDIKSTGSYYENIMVVYEGGTFLISYDDLTEMVKNVDFLIQKKRTRTWGTAITHPNIDFEEFREFLLYNEDVTTEEMERILHLISIFFENKRDGVIFIREEDIEKLNEKI